VAQRLPGLRFCAVLAVVARTRGDARRCGRFPGGATLTGATVLCGFGCCRLDEGRCAPFAGDSPVALRLPGLRFCAVLAVVARTRGDARRLRDIPGGAVLTGATVLCGFGCCRLDEGRCAPFAGDSPVALRLPGLRFCAVLAVVAWMREMRAVCGISPGGATLTGATVLCGFGFL
jgi:peptidoglycan/LPS O-acetylase OafA/YrhL